jgi:hypothetical protein
MSVSVTPTKAFIKYLKRLGNQKKADAAIKRLRLFAENPGARELNFESVKTKRGYFSIRVDYHSRILLREIEAGKSYEAVAVGNHDVVYDNYFR